VTNGATNVPTITATPEILRRAGACAVNSAQRSPPLTSSSSSTSAWLCVRGKCFHVADSLTDALRRQLPHTGQPQTWQRSYRLIHLTARKAANTNRCSLYDINKKLCSLCYCRETARRSVSANSYTLMLYIKAYRTRLSVYDC